MRTVREASFQVLEGVVYYVDPTTSSNAMNAFVGNNERVHIPLSGTHSSNNEVLQVMKCNQFCLCRLRHTLVS